MGSGTRADAWPEDLATSGALLNAFSNASRDSLWIEASTISGPEGLGTVDIPLPLALGGVWWCSTPEWESETRVTALPENLAASRPLISVRI
eukprot:6204862-Pleurochrysis_carterae.AAC.1